MRLFTAILFPEPVKEQIVQIQTVLHAHGTGNFTRPENLHLTLAFLGETQQEDAAIQTIRQMESTLFALRFSLLGNFGDLLWAGIAHSPALSVLQKNLMHHLAAQGFSLETREYIPHVTLCRNYRPIKELPVDEINETLQQISFSPDRVSLMESITDNKKIVYQERFFQKI